MLLKVLMDFHSLQKRNKAHMCQQHIRIKHYLARDSGFKIQDSGFEIQDSKRKVWKYISKRSTKF